MRPGNARVPLVIAIVAAGMTYHLVGWSSPLGGMGSAIHGFTHTHPERDHAPESTIPVSVDATPAADFDGVILEAKATASIVIGEASKVVVDSTIDSERGIKTYVEDGKLIVTGHGSSAHITVTLPHLRSLRTDGPCNVTLTGLRDPVVIVANGPAILHATGSVDSLELRLNGPSNLTMTELQAKAVSIVMNGSGDAKLYATDSLVAAVRGMGRVRYLGEPKTVKVIQGQGSIGPLDPSTEG